jgi:hypothetical protein
MANSTNIAPLITPEIAATLTSSDQIISFGNQLIKQVLQPVVLGNQSVTNNQNNALKDLTTKQQQAGTNKNDVIRKANRDYKNKKITQEQYNRIVANTNAAYDAEMASIKSNRQQIQQSKNTELNDFQKSIKNEQNKIKVENTKLKTNTVKAEVKSKVDLAKQVLTNPSNLTAIYPALGLLITNSFLLFVSQRKKLEKQVEVVNLYIDTKVIDEQSVLVATNLKNNTIKAINNAIAKLKAIEAILKTINTALKIASIALRILKLLLTFLPAVPGAVLTVFETLNKVINGLTSILTPCISILSNEIAKLKELIERLKQIIIKLNNKTLAILTDDQLLNLIQTILPVGDVNLFSTLTAVPVSGSAGFVNIGGRIVPLNSTSAAGSLPATGTGGIGIGGIGTGGTGTGTGTGVAGTGGGIGTGTGTGVTGTGGGGIGTGIGTGGAATGIGTGIITTGSIGATGTGVGGAGIGATGTGVGIGGTGTGSIGVGTAGATGVGIAGTGVGGAGIGVAGTGTGTAGTGVGGTGTGVGTGGTGTSNVPIINANNISGQVVTGSVGSTNGTGIGVTTTGGTGTGGVNVGPTGVIPNTTGSGVLNVGSGGVLGNNTNNGEIALDSGINGGLDVDGQLIFPINLDQLSIAGLDEATLDQLESLSLETLEDPQPQPTTSTSQVPSLQDQAGLYKGFKFQIKEEQDPRFVVRGTIKRRYAVAINRQGVEVLKSEYSFTLDPNDLVDQLKLIIDKQKLQG